MSKNIRQNRRKEPKVSQMDKQGWKSLLVVIGEIVLTCIFACGIPYGAYRYYQHLSGTGYFEPHRITIAGNVRVTDDQIREASGLLQEGVNLFEVDVHNVESGIMTLPWVKSVNVKIELPDGVNINIDEHKPLGLVNDGQLYVVDEAGMAIKHWTSDDALMSPLVSLDKTLGTHNREVVKAFELVKTIRRMGYLRDISEVHYDDATGYTLYTDETEIRIGYDRFEDRIERLLIVEDALKTRNVDAAYILLDGDTTLDKIVVKPRVYATITEPEQDAASDGNQAPNSEKENGAH